jgi:formylglycine-generating enzyme required for sulfatase activity
MPLDSLLASRVLLLVTVGVLASRALAQNALEGPEQVADAMRMIDVPAGAFVMGTEREAGFQNGYPPHAVHIPAF